MVNLQMIIRQVQNVFGDVKLPIRISLLDHDGLEIYSTDSMNEMQVNSTEVLILNAFEQLIKATESRDDAIDTLIIRTRDKEYFVAPVAAKIFMSAVAEIGKIAPMLIFLDGLRAQIAFAINNL